MKIAGKVKHITKALYGMVKNYILKKISHGSNIEKILRRQP